MQAHTHQLKLVSTTAEMESDSIDLLLYQKESYAYKINECCRYWNKFLSYTYTNATAHYQLITQLHVSYCIPH